MNQQCHAGTQTPQLLLREATAHVLHPEECLYACVGAAVGQVGISALQRDLERQGGPANSSFDTRYCSQINLSQAPHKHHSALFVLWSGWCFACFLLQANGK